MLFSLINFICSTAEAMSCYLIMASRSERTNCMPYADFFLILLQGFAYSFINNKLPIGTILGTILQVIWARYCLQGKASTKFLGYSVWFLFVMFFDWATMICAELLHVSDGIPITAALLDQSKLRMIMMLISKFLLLSMTTAYLLYQQKRRRMQTWMQISLAKVILFLFLSVLGFVMLLTNGYYYDGQNFSRNISYVVLIVPLLMVILFLFVIFLFYVLNYTNMAAYHYEQALQKDKLERRHYENMQLLEQELNNWKAIAQEQLQILQSCISSDTGKYFRWQEDAMQSLLWEENLLLTGNTVFDIIISQKIKQARGHGILLQANIQQIGALVMEETDIVCLMSNLLDNACEAVEKLDSENRRIYLEIRSQDDCLLIKTENLFRKTVIDSKNRLRTTKSDTKLHGHGINCMKSVVEKYQGTLQYHVEHGVFTMKILLQSSSGLDA